MRTYSSVRGLGCRFTFSLVIGALGGGFISAPARAALLVFSGTGNDTSGLSTTVAAYEAAIGGANNGVGGSFSGGFRQINWDGTPAAQTSPNPLAPNFFNANSARGAVFNTVGGSNTSFLVSSDSGTAGFKFGDQNASYPASFTTFSAPRLFSPVGSNVMDVKFFLPGTGTPATVKGFGAVFADVDLPNLTSIQFLGPTGQLISTLGVPVNNNGLSFVGGVNDGTGPAIASVRITAGNSNLGSAETAANDVVVMDDFIYGEPVPEPASAGLLLAGLLIAAHRRPRASR